MNGVVAADLAPGGVLRAAINLGNPVLAAGTAEQPSGVTVDLATEIGRRLGLSVAWVCSHAARHAFAALAGGTADLCFLAVEPEREADVAFTAPYLLIEGAYAVRASSPLSRADEVDAAGVRVGVKQGSAYDLHLTRSLNSAQVVRGEEGVEVFAEQALEVAAGILQPLRAHVERTPGLRLLDGAFMQIRQAVGTGRDRTPETVRWLAGTVEELKADGFVAQALARAGHHDIPVAPLVGLGGRS